MLARLSDVFKGVKVRILAGGSAASVKFSRINPLSEMMGVTEFMISWVSARISFCHDSTSC